MITLKLTAKASFEASVFWFVDDLEKTVTAAKTTTQVAAKVTLIMIAFAFTNVLTFINLLEHAHRELWSVAQNNSVEKIDGSCLVPRAIFVLAGSN